MPELANPIFPVFAQVIESMLAQHGFTPVLCTQTPGGSTEDEYVEMLLDRSVAGIIFVSGLHADTSPTTTATASCVDRGLPIVLINGYAEGLDAPCVSCDDRLAMRPGGRPPRLARPPRIGLIIGPRPLPAGAAQAHRFRAAMQRHLGLDESLRRAVPLRRRGRRRRRRPPHRAGRTGLVCGSDLMALGAIRAARARGLSVPEDSPWSATTTRRSSRSPTRR